eukprot:1185102-Prorocentrum_minimum.AAC.2
MNNLSTFSSKAAAHMVLIRAAGMLRFYAVDATEWRYQAGCDIPAALIRTVWAAAFELKVLKLFYHSPTRHVEAVRNARVCSRRHRRSDVPLAVWCRVASPLLPLVSAMGIFSLPFCHWCPLWVYSLSPYAIGARFGYILSPLL